MRFIIYILFASWAYADLLHHGWRFWDAFFVEAAIMSAGFLFEELLKAIKGEQ